MKHSTRYTLAAAIVGISACAHAQSSVTLYGTVDAGIEYLTNAAKTNKSMVREQSGNLWGDKWGLLIKEDLGGGYRAFAQLENGFTINDGALGQSGRMFGRKALVGLSKDGTTIQMGRLYNPLYETTITYDPTGYALYSLATHDTGFVGREDNAVKLTQKYGSWTGMAFYSFGYDSVGTPYGSTAGAASQAKELSFALSYQGAVFGATAIYDNTHGPLTSTSAGLSNLSTSLAPTSSTAADRAERYMAAVKFKLPRNTVTAGYRLLRTSLHSGSPVTRNVSTMFVGDQFQITPVWAMTGAVYHSRVAGLDIRPTTAVLDLDYILSKRTDLYVNASYVWNTRLSTMGVDIANSTLAGTNQLGVQAGIRVNF
ncbi:porin [Burkholderia multivorans]|uniref:porin n=1 Tax=Burkholderia multivorans TaxID=87883 RepID=UPI001C24D883|nr:porin [Burkholderia multivorans]MBU9185757.1 porin [Burkholderia multivorans]MBU9420755.1 porin [Burkholderia multivorans]MDN7451279.1 porin [Burkholderia multivorans]